MGCTSWCNRKFKLYLLNTIPLHSFECSVACTASNLKGRLLKALSDKISDAAVHFPYQSFALQVLNIDPLCIPTWRQWSKEEIILTMSFSTLITFTVITDPWIMTLCTSHVLIVFYSAVVLLICLVCPSVSYLLSPPFLPEVRAWREWKGKIQVPEQ